MNKLILPGLVDPHVHLRDPGETEKEDFHTGTSAALAGGYTTILDMPNNRVAITTPDLLREKIAIAKDKIVCNVGFYFGSIGDNLEEFSKVAQQTFGLKLYLNETTGNFLIEQNKLETIFSSWTGRILVHAEEKMLEEVINMVKTTRHPTHVCHVSRKEELAMIIQSKEENFPISCGVTPHHLFLTEDDTGALGPFGKMKPPLASKNDVEFLWKNLSAIDVVESDHAPHTKGEKQSGTPPYGVPGLETTLPLLLTAMHDGRMTKEDIIRLCFENPAKNFGIKSDNDTRIEIDMDESYDIDNRYLLTKSGWSPFAGWKVKGKVVRVFIRGTKVFEDRKVLVQPGFGRILTP